MKKIIVTGGSGFIGTNFIYQQLSCTNNKILNIDKLTYAGNILNHKENELKWKQLETFETGLKKTVEWYINNEDWYKCILKNTK